MPSENEKNPNEEGQQDEKGQRHYMALTPPPDLRAAYFIADPSPTAARRKVQDYLEDVVKRNPPNEPIGFRVVDLPSRRVKPGALPGKPRPDQDRPAQEQARPQHRDGGSPAEAAGTGERPQSEAHRRVVIVIRFDKAEMRDPFFSAIRRSGIAPDVEIGVDLRIRPADHWCPGYATQPLFGDRAVAEALIRAEAVKNPPQNAALPVNVIIVDEGLKAARISEGVTFGNGWVIDDNEPGMRRPGEAVGRHGSMVMRNALSFADRAAVTLLDCPLLPDVIHAFDEFVSLAQVVFESIFDLIHEERLREEAERRRASSWVLVNAWGVFDLANDPTRDYAGNPEHALHRTITAIEGLGVDIVFAAGNCGQFCPNPRCGADDRGPARSIHGANSHPAVLTAGAVRADGLWLGYSSEGPGQPGLSAEKPDVCAPSQFGEAGDFSPAGSNTGTSAACGMAAGVVVALRHRVAPDSRSPADLRASLRETAWRPAAGPDAVRRFGSGIINVEEAARLLAPPAPGAFAMI